MDLYFWNQVKDLKYKYKLSNQRHFTSEFWRQTHLSFDKNEKKITDYSNDKVKKEKQFFILSWLK